MRCVRPELRTSSLPIPTYLSPPPPPPPSSSQAATFPIGAYTYKEVQTAFAAVRAHWPDAEVRVALYNAGYGVRKPFLELTEAEVAESVETQVTAAFAFAREALLAFQAQALDARGKRGTLLLTGATASWRGNTTTAAFAAGKFGLRALSQSLNKEFGKQNIHVGDSRSFMSSCLGTAGLTGAVYVAL